MLFINEDRSENLQPTLPIKSSDKSSASLEIGKGYFRKYSYTTPQGRADKINQQYCKLRRLTCVSLEFLYNFFRLQIPYVDHVILRSRHNPLKRTVCQITCHSLEHKLGRRRKPQPRITLRKITVPFLQLLRNLQRCSISHSCDQCTSSDTETKRWQSQLLKHYCHKTTTAIC